ncbi:DUF3576 domain-containing protein, partial [Candidatus Pelagibacter communis]|uniref:DUF3576 domain-containing protein n=1 Tax=Pelagibacter ubique TaxID=198252 RepID=UPI00094C5A00
MKNILIFILISIMLSSCGVWRPADARKVPVNANERVQKNMNEGRGFRLGTINKNGGDFMFASSNPMWRATMEKLSFAPLGVVDYGGGIIITDWFSDGKSTEELKIAVRFLTNEIRSDAIKVIIHKRECKTFNNCVINELNNSTNNEIKFAILKKAAEIETQVSEKKNQLSISDLIPNK